MRTQVGDVLVVPSDSIEDAVLQEDDDGRVVGPASAVAVASRDGLLGALKVALSNGQDINAFLGGCNGLHLAILSGHQSLASHLIEHRIDVNMPDRAGFTPLRLVALSNQLDDEASVKLATDLLSQGAVADSTAIDYARARHKQGLVELLLGLTGPGAGCRPAEGSDG